MYSIVMMTALTASPDAAQFNGYFRDLFSRDNRAGCDGGVRYSCFGGGCSGAAAYPAANCTGCLGTCHGSCHGGGFLGFGFGDRVRRVFDREPAGNCTGRSYGYGCGCSGMSLSCNGSAYSCFGGPVAYGGSCYGGPVAYGGSCFGSYPMMGAPIYNPSPAPMIVPQPGTPNIPYAIPDPAPGTFGFNQPLPQPTVVASNRTGRAAVIVKLPVDARLFADDRVLNLTGAERKFVSPELPIGQEFVYRFKAEYERDGEIVSVTKRVTVQAGATATVEFNDLTAAKANPAPTAKPTAEKPTKPATPTALPTPPKPELPPVTPVNPTATATTPPTPSTPDAPSARATIVVKLPPGATLYVDDRKSPSAEPVRNLTTPMLPPNREYAYLLKAEVMREGRPETLTQKVPFRAGERVEVDFTALGK
jgi:uncharacterized protein (TIGR03000 family)